MPLERFFAAACALSDAYIGQATVRDMKPGTQDCSFWHLCPHVPLMVSLQRRSAAEAATVALERAPSGKRTIPADCALEVFSPSLQRRSAAEAATAALDGAKRQADEEAERAAREKAKRQRLEDDNRVGLGVLGF
jgi:hypothetical protein